MAERPHSLTEDQIRILNDHDLRWLIEQNVEIRHQETLSVAMVSLTLVLLSLVFRDFHWPDPEVLKSAAGVNAKLLILRKAAGLRVSSSLLIGGFLFGTGLIFRANTRSAERRISLICNQLAQRNNIDIIYFFETQNFRQPKRLWRTQGKISGTDRDYLPSIVLYIGLIIFLLLFLANIILNIPILK